MHLNRHFGKLFADAFGSVDFSAIFIDDFDKLFTHRRRAMQHQWKAGQLFFNFAQNVKAQSAFAFIFVCAVTCANRNGK